MRQRLEQLKAEFEKGQEQLLMLEQRRQQLRDTMLRIEGAIQVLEELLCEETSVVHTLKRDTSERMAMP